MCVRPLPSVMALTMKVTMSSAISIGSSPSTNGKSNATAATTTTGTVRPMQAKAEPMTTASVDENALALTVLATVLFSNPDNSSPQTSGNGGGGGTTPSGGTNPPPTSEAPEPATLLSALVGTGLAGLFAAFRRKRLTGGEAKPTV